MVLTFRALKGQSSAYIRDMFIPYNPVCCLRSRVQNLSVVPCTRFKTCGDQSFFFYGLWNALPSPPRKRVWKPSLNKHSTELGLVGFSASPACYLSVLFCFIFSFCLRVCFSAATDRFMGWKFLSCFTNVVLLIFFYAADDCTAPCKFVSNEKILLTVTFNFKMTTFLRLILC